MSGLVFRVLAKAGHSSEGRQRQKSESSHFQPKLVQDASERTGSGSQSVQEGSASAAAGNLLGCYAGYNAQLSRRRHLFHWSILAVCGGRIMLCDVTEGCDVDPADPELVVGMSKGDSWIRN